MKLTLFLLPVMVIATFALENGLIVDYTQVAACARGCSILTVAQGICVPPVAPAADKAIYLDCFCKSPYLQALYNGGDICHESCTAVDALTIHQYYLSLCDSASPPQTSSSSTSTPTWSPSPTPSSTANEPTTAPSPPTDTSDKAKKPETWLHRHWNTLFIAGLVGAFAFATLLCLAWLYWRRRNANTKKADRERGMIPLQLLSTARPVRSARSTHPPSRSQTPESTDNFPATVPASPLASPHSPESFGETLRRQAEEERERDEAFQRRARLLALVRSHSRPNGLADGLPEEE
jgi:hypothetical protein